MYALAPRTRLYAEIRSKGLVKDLTTALASGNTAFPSEWFILSGGYGILHALESARPYSATFSQYPKTHCTTCGASLRPYCSMKDWKKVIPRLLVDIVSKATPTHIFIFGDNTYLSLTAALPHANVTRINSGRTPGAPGRLLKLTEMILGAIPFDFAAV